jgi:hypothetical protein
MKASLLSIALVLWTSLVGAAAAESGVPASSHPGAALVAVETPAGGEPMLVVRYPWKVHARPSVEVRSFGKTERDSPRISPLHFRNDFMKDEFTIGVYRAQDAAYSVRTIADMKRRDIEFVAIGERNLFGRPAVVVTCRTDILLTRQVKDPEQGRWAIYPLLDDWGADDRTLFLSLPASDFTEAARIRIWFLSGDDIVWSETVDWPGLKESPSAG